MAPKTFLLLALAFAVVLLITSEVVAANDLASNHDSEVDDHGLEGYDNGGRGGYNRGGRGGYSGGGGHGKGGGGGYGKGGGGHGKGGCRYGCCGGGRYNRGGCKCCSTFAEATAYKQTQN